MRVEVASEISKNPSLIPLPSVSDDKFNDQFY